MQYFEEKNIKKNAVAIFFSNFKNMRYLQFGIYSGFGSS